MTFVDLTGASGVFMVLLAFFLNLFNYLDKDSKVYILLNFTGAGIACYASVLINYFPFVVLEGTWCFVSLIAMIKVFR
jgi:hypothetical protein